MSQLSLDDVELRRQTITEAWNFLGREYGGKKAVLEMMGLESYEAVRKWVAQGYMPTDRAKQFERLSRGKYKREQLNPDFAP